MNKKSYLYILTPDGIKKTILTLNFMKRKMAEYDELKMEIEELEKIKSIKKWIYMTNKNLNIKLKRIVMEVFGGCNILVNVSSI